MAWTYGERPFAYRRMALRKEALNAEWDSVPDGPAGDVIRQLRWRAHEARVRAFWIFQLLLLVIILGLGFYLGLPFWQQYADGRKATLEELVRTYEFSKDELGNQTQDLRSKLLTSMRFVSEDDTDLGVRTDKNFALDFRGSEVLVGGEGQLILYDYLSGEEKSLLGVSENANYINADYMSGQRLLVLTEDEEFILDTNSMSLSGPIVDNELRQNGMTSERLANLRDAGRRETVIHVTKLQGDNSLDAFLKFLNQDFAWPLSDRVRHVQQAVIPVEASLLQLEKQREEALEKLDRIKSLTLHEERQTFSDFLATCRGVQSDNPTINRDGFAPPEPDAITLACLEGWKAQRSAEENNWWQTLASQVPPGILLLFLLATLTVLYRYNMRLSSFHHSRADALTLAAWGGESIHVGGFASVAETLAADAVEFGKSSVKLGAAEMNLSRKSSSDG